MTSPDAAARDRAEAALAVQRRATRAYQQAWLAAQAYIPASIAKSVEAALNESLGKLNLKPEPVQLEPEDDYDFS